MTEPWQKHLLAAEGYLELGMMEEALQFLDLIPEEEISSPEVSRLRVEIHSRTGQWPEAAAIARHMVIINPEDPQWWISLAYATRRAEDIRKAEKILLDATTFHPDEPLIRYNLACYSSVQGRLDEARLRLDHALSLSPELGRLAAVDEDFAPLRAGPPA